MIEHFPEQIEAWHEFYVMLGSGAAALTGLLFVIASLGPHVMASHTETGVKAFVSPIAVHFTSALVVSALMLAAVVPSSALGALLSLGGLGGIIYTAWTRAHEQWRRNKLPPLDWIWFAGLPYLGFALILGSGIAVAMHVTLGLHSVALATTLLIVVGIRNAWDVVLWVAQQPPGRGKRV
jgi:hypothetical protein